MDNNNSSLHTAEQNQQKRDAIDLAVRELAFQYKSGTFASNNSLMYNAIDNLASLLSEYRRG